MATKWYFEGAVMLALLLVVGAEEGVEEAGESPEEAKALGLTMLGGIFFIMGMYYLTHSWDPDIRLLTWATINDTISIFCAVMLYSSITDLCEMTTQEEGYANVEKRIWLNKAYVVFWYTLFCGGIAWCCGLGHRDGVKWRKEAAKKEPFHHDGKAEEYDTPVQVFKSITTSMAYGPLNEDVKQSGVIKKPQCANSAKAESSFSQYTQMKNNLRCCTLFAHTTGFAGIAGWRLRMHSPWFEDSAWHCATLIPYALVEYYFVIKMTQIGRRLFIWKFVEGGRDHVKLMDAEKAEDSEEDEEDELLEVFEDTIVDGENDFFGLFMSTLVVNTIKFGVGGLEGEEDEEYKFNRGLLEALIMYVVAVAFFISAFGLLDLRRTLEERADTEETPSGEGKPLGEAFYENFSKSIWRCLPEGYPYSRFVIDEGAKTIQRLGDLFVKILTMSFAWSFMTATQWFLGHCLEGEGSVLAISLAMTVSVFSVLQIFVLDKIADKCEEKRAKDRTEKKSSGKEDDEVLRTLLQSIGILIGFVWESAFDDALEGIVGKDNECLWVKPVLGILTVAVMFPVWRMYIVPMEIEKGYILGFMPSKVAHRMKRIFEDESIGADVQEGARVVFEEAMMVMLAFDKDKQGELPPGLVAIRSHLSEFFKEDYQPPPIPPGTTSVSGSSAEGQTKPGESEAGVDDKSLASEVQQQRQQ